jgi:hypothetical protein
MKCVREGRATAQFDPITGHVGFVVDEVALMQVLSIKS